MAKFCMYCGTALPEGAAFCPQCGKPVPIQIPAPAGAQVMVSDAPPETPAAKPKAPAKRTAASRSSAEAAPAKEDAPAEKKEPVKKAAPAKAASPKEEAPPEKKKPVQKKSKRGLSFFLTLVMLVELAVAGFKYPGFLLPDQPDPAIHWTATATPATARATAKPAEQATKKATAKPDAAEAASANTLSLRYTTEQIASAPAKTADVSVWEPQADLGGVQVDLKSWNLDAEDDRLTVKELPEISQGEDGWAIKAYDFSLASGQRDFSTDVIITLPRDETDALGSCVWFNEAENRWEDVYSEVSADGRSYILRANHFSLFGTKKYVFDAKNLKITESDGTTFDLTHGIFAETPKKGLGIMQLPVKIDFRRMWNLFKDQTMNDAKNAGNLLALLSKDTESIASWRNTYALADKFSTLVGCAGVDDNYNGVLGNIAYDTPLIGRAIGCLDIALTTLKLVAEAKGSGRDYTSAVWDSIKNHKADIAGSTISLVGIGWGTASATAGWVIALVGLLVWGGAKMYEQATAGEWFTKQVMDPDAEQLYKNFYYANGVRIDFGSPVNDERYMQDYHNVIMVQHPPTMEVEEYDVLAKAIEKKGLTIKCHVDEKRPGINDKWVFDGWSEAFVALLKLYGDDPARLGLAIDELYYCYADAFWEFPEVMQMQFIRSTVKNPENEFYKNGVSGLSFQQKEKITQAFITTLKVKTLDQLRAAGETLQREMCENVIRQMEAKLLPVLNTELVFRVEDENSPKGFQKSKYCVDWTTIKQNKKFTSGGEGVRYDSPELITPMRFADVGNPKFIPLLPVDTMFPDQPSANRADRYYPYTKDFLPQANGKDNVVFRCTYYHYLMMGAPTAMIFKEVSDPEHYAAAESLTANFKVPEITLANGGEGKQVNVTVRIQKDEAEEYVISNVDGHGSVETAFEYDDFLIEKALKDAVLKLKSDGRFTLSVSADDAHNGEQTFTSLSLIPMGDEEDPDPAAWQQFSRSNHLEVTLTGAIDRTTNKGTCDLTGSSHGSQTFKVGHKSGKVTSTTTTHTGTYTGSTQYVTLESGGLKGKTLQISFFYKKDEKGNNVYDLMRTGTTKREGGSAEPCSAYWWLELTFVKKR